MFGNTNQNQSTPAFGGFGTNQNTQPPNAFGSGTTPFGTNQNTTNGIPIHRQANTAFGGGTPSAFGARPSGGLFGSGPTNTTSAFGQPAQNNTTSAFGTPGGFGSSTGSTGAFGSNTSTGTGLFGAPKPATSAFGSTSFGAGGTGAFGGTSTGLGTTTNSAFGGSTLGGFGQNVNVSPVPVTGTSNPPYQITSEKEPGQTYSTNFHAITMMPAYRNASFEELRLADYAQGRRYGTGGAFGTPSTFGGTSTATPSAFGGFGASTNTSTPTAFGQPAQPTTTSSFGTGFGSTSTPFGQSTGSTGGFGSQTTGGFGTGTTGTTGGFGAGTTAFGQSSNTSAFGQKPGGFSLGGFGTGTSTTGTQNAFGSNTGTTNAFGTPSTNTGFGSNTSTPATGSTWGGFGAGNPSTGATGGFGTNTSAEQKPAFGGFGTGQGTAGTTSTPSTGAFGGFGQKPAGTGGFGGFGAGTTGGFGSNTTPSNTGGLGTFGQSTSAPSTTGAGLGGFGTTNTGTTGGFGSGGLFGNKPAISSFNLGGGTGTGLGGSTGTSGGFGFGGNSGGFGSGNNTFNLGGSTQNTGTSLLGTPQSQQQQNQLQQSIMSSPYGTNPLFQMGSTSTFGGDVSKPIVPIATLVPKEGKDEKAPALLAGFRLTPSSGKSRFSLGGGTSPLNGSPYSARKRDVLGLGTPTRVLLTATPTNGSGIEMTPEAFVVPKKGLKSLEISRTKKDLNITGSEAKSIDGPDGTTKSPAVDHRLEREAREKERQRAEPLTSKPAAEERQALPAASPSKPRQSEESGSPPQQRKTTPPRSVVSVSTDKTYDPTSDDDGTYWTIPTMDHILSMRDLRAVPNFVVGRKGYGQVRFNQPVDLSQVRSIPDIPGEIVVFDLKICTVYPDESIKPPVGRGLNVPATITLEKCWPLSKETRKPILDVQNPRFIAHVERLKRQPDTEFIDYIADTGSWVFKVNHF
jgi:nuclear pore complex protein Nup98-Nup96